MKLHVSRSCLWKMWKKDRQHENVKVCKRLLRPYNNKCPECGQTLSTSEFTLDVREN